MAPLTRLRAGPTQIPNALMAEYYGQRASAGLLITEGVPVTPQGVGYAGVPGIWSQEQVEGWKQVTKAVHDKGGRIFMQIWHVGRISDPSLPERRTAGRPQRHRGQGPCQPAASRAPLPHPARPDDRGVAGVVEAFRKGAQNAKDAGFDGVEIHGANGYLLDQFLQDGSNQRTDQYGGPIENRARLLLEVDRRLRSRCSAPAASACTWRRAPTATAWATATWPPPSAMSPRPWASARSPSSRAREA
jgi:2,4-dienoyl-CoA reductase-like NADH-dependent reductase (Old Yellow Enzyme family)